MYCVHVVVISGLSAVSVDNGVVQWTISSSLPGECYGSYSLQLSQCTIEDFAILPVLNTSDDAVKPIFAGKLLLIVNLFDFFVFIVIDFISPGISAATIQTCMAAVYTASNESVDIDNCVRPTLRTSITPASISGRLVLSSASTEDSTSQCNISLSSEGVASTSSLVISCNASGELY